jgi:hypothetical protein
MNNQDHETAQRGADSCAAHGSARLIRCAGWVSPDGRIEWFCSEYVPADSNDPLAAAKCQAAKSGAVRHGWEIKEIGRFIGKKWVKEM